MRKIFSLVVMTVLAVATQAQVSKIVGDWTTVDDKTGEKRSVVHIFKATDGLYYGKVIKLFNAPENAVCKACEGADANKPVVGLQIVRGMHEEDGMLVGGKVLDPESGKLYYCKISLQGNKLTLRGSLDKRGMLGRNQTWVK